MQCVAVRCSVLQCVAAFGFDKGCVLLSILVPSGKACCICLQRSNSLLNSRKSEFSDLLVASFTQVKNLEELGQHGKLGAAELGEAGGKKIVNKSCP